MEVSKMGTVNVIEESTHMSTLDDKIKEDLSLLNVGVVFDFSRQEIVFELTDGEIILFDFKEFSIQEVDTQTFHHYFGSSINQIPNYYQKLISQLTQQLNCVECEVMLCGQGVYQFLAIPFYHNYIVIGQIFVDMDDFVPPDDDPDGGEPCPDEESGFFMYFCLYFFCFMIHFCKIIFSLFLWKYT